MYYKIFCDAACDIDVDVVKNYDLNIFQMEYTCGYERLQSDGVDTPESLIKLYNTQKNGDVTKTFQIEKSVYVETFEKFVVHGIGVLYIALSSGLTPSYNTAVSAKKLLERKYNKKLPIYVIDSKSASGGIALLVERALDNQRRNVDIDVNYRDIIDVVNDVRVDFFVDSLNYLYAGGRLSRASAFIGTLLKVKPLLKVNLDGELEQLAKVNGDKNVLNGLFDIYSKNHKSSFINSVYIAHADNAICAEKLKVKINSLTPDVKVKVKLMTLIISAHVGPGSVILSYCGTKN